jgi:hypothetical protein
MIKQTLVLLLAVAVAVMAIDEANVAGMERVLPKSNACKLLFSTGFENNFDDYTNKGYPITPALDASKTAGSDAETLMNIGISNTIVKSGSKSFVATSTGLGSKAKNGYGSIMFSEMNDIAQFTPIYVETQVYFDKQLPAGLYNDIISMASDDKGERQINVRVDENMKIAFYHVTKPYGTDYLYQNTEVTVPIGKWVNVTAYYDFNPTKAVVALWLDGTLVNVANVQLVNGGIYVGYVGSSMLQWVQEGSTYFDDIRVWSVGAKCQSQTASNGIDLILSASSASPITISGLVLTMMMFIAMLF